MSDPTPLPASEVEEAMAAVVSHYLGATMARSAIEVHREKLGLVGPQLTAGDVAALVQKLGAGLIVFLGREKATAVVAEIEQAVLNVRQDR